MLTGRPPFERETPVETLLEVGTADVVPPEAAPFDLPSDQLVFTVIGEEGAVEMRGCAG